MSHFKRVAIRRMLGRDPKMCLAKRIQAGPNFTVEFRKEINRWEVMEHGGHRGVRMYLENALDLVIDLDDSVLIPQDISVLA